MGAPEPVAAANGASHAEARPPGKSLWRRTATGLGMAQVRLRFLFILLAIFAVVGKWELVQTYWDKLTRQARPPKEGVSSETEYWCPMCPGVVSDWPGKCPACNMALVQRTRGEAVPFPDGVLARMQLSPYRMQLAGVQTSAVAYRPLVHEVELTGFVEGDDGRLVGSDPSRCAVRAEAFDRDLPYLSEGRAVEVTSDALAGRPSCEGKVRAVTPNRKAGRYSFQVWLEVNNSGRELRPGMLVTAHVHVPVAEVEPFRSTPAGSPPLETGSPRKVYTCPEHPEVLCDHPGKCPQGTNELDERPLAANQQLQWWCPMHPRVTAMKPGGVCKECKGMKLVPRVVTYRPPGEVLAVPESAVIDTGSKRMVYVERGPGMFDGVAVVLGPRCGDQYPVVRGLEAGQKVVTSGAFLVDAETRLNPAVATGYFGAGTAAGDRPGPAPAPSVRADDSPVARALQKLPPADRALAARQKVCPVTGEPLGSMGVPKRVVVQGKVVFLCCDGCEDELREHPEKYLSKHRHD